MKRYLISSWIVESLPADLAVEALAAAGFAAIELSGGVAPLLLAWERDPVAVLRKLNAAGIGVPSVHCPVAGRCLDVVDNEARQASIAANRRYLELMRESGVPEIVIHPTSSPDTSTPEKREACRRRCIDSLKVTADAAGMAGVRMAVENLGRNGVLGSTMADLLDMTEGLGDHVGLCHDVGHSEQAGLDLLGELAAATAAGKLFSLHIHDVIASGRDHFVPGDGRIDFRAFIARLDASGFCGLRTLEIRPPATDVHTRLRQAAAVIDGWTKS